MPDSLAVVGTLFFSKPKKALRLNLGVYYSIRDRRSTKFAQMIVDL